jgi:hypothetical protein
MRLVVLPLLLLVTVACESKPAPPPAPSEPSAAAAPPAATPQAVEVPPDKRLPDSRPGTLKRACSPSDGSAFALVIRRSDDREFPRTTADVYQPLGGAKVFRVDNPGLETGRARYCVKSSRCQEARAFRVEITPVAGESGEPKRAYGRVVLLHESTERIVPFDVEVDPTPATCG